MYMYVINYRVFFIWKIVIENIFTWKKKYHFNKAYHSDCIFFNNIFLSAKWFKYTKKWPQKSLNCLQPRNYQVSKEVVHELKFEDIAVMQI